MSCFWWFESVILHNLQICCYFHFNIRSSHGMEDNNSYMAFNSASIFYASDSSSTGFRIHFITEVPHQQVYKHKPQWSGIPSCLPPRAVYPREEKGGWNPSRSQWPPPPSASWWMQWPLSLSWGMSVAWRKRGRIVGSMSTYWMVGCTLTVLPSVHTNPKHPNPNSQTIPWYSVFFNV